MRLRTGSKATGAYAQKPFKTVESFNLDGLELARVRNTKRREWPIRQVLFFLLAIISFKVFLFIDMGPASYGNKVAELANGTAMERAASWAMALDPVSAWIANGIKFGNWN